MGESSESRKTIPHQQTTDEKAKEINFSGKHYGTFAEIGAGQEVVRHFFKAGGASGTVAKSMSAYDMRVSDAIYGHPKRYVSRERLEQMLQHEYQLLVDRLAPERGAQTRFFAFADTVATTPHDGKGQGHSWIGLRFQEAPLSLPSEVLLHLRLWDKDAGRQQDALGIVGVNLIHAALNARTGVDAFLTALVEGVGVGRVEVEFVHFKGPAFGAFDNRSAALRLVRLGLTDAVLFGPEGDQPLDAAVVALRFEALGQELAAATPMPPPSPESLAEGALAIAVERMAEANRAYAHYRW